MYLLIFDEGGGDMYDERMMVKNDAFVAFSFPLGLRRPWLSSSVFFFSFV